MLKRRLKNIFIATAAPLSLIWATSLWGFSHPGFVIALALVPRSADGALGVLTMPLVHASFAHLSANTSMFVVLAVLVQLESQRYYLRATLLILTLAGAALWLIGRAGAHVGASVLIFGYFGLLLSRGLFERRFQAMLVSLLVAGVFAWMLWGVLPGAAGVSWEGHLTGLLAGMATARALAGFRPAAASGGTRKARRSVGKRPG